MLGQHLEIRELEQNQVALISVNKLVKRLALPGEVIAFWKNSIDTSIEVENFAESLTVPGEWVKAIKRSGDAVALATLSSSMRLKL